MVINIKFTPLSDCKMFPFYIGTGSTKGEEKRTNQKSAVLVYICNKLNIESHQAKKMSGEESSTIPNHIRCSKNTFTVVNVVFCTKSQIL